MFDFTLVLGIIIVSASVTILLRFLPFALTTFLNNSPYLQYLGKHMPVGVTLLLVAYTLKDVQFDTAPYGLPMIIATILCIVVYLLTRHALWAIAFGLGGHLLMVNTEILAFIH